MVVSDVRDGPRGAWRSLSGDVEKPIARRGGAYRGAKTQKIVFLTHYHLFTSSNFAELCRTLHFVEVQIFDFVNLHTKTVSNEQ